jgi:hypothetical protein
MNIDHFELMISISPIIPIFSVYLALGRDPLPAGRQGRGPQAGIIETFKG